MSLIGNTNEEKIWNFLFNKLKNIYAVAGLMGNIYAESGLNPMNLQNSFNKSLNMTDEEYTKAVDNGSYTNFIKDSAGYGLTQTTYWNRKQNLLNYAITNGTSIGDLEMQLNFLIWELQNGYRSVWNKLLIVESVREASDIVLTEFEKPANQGETVKVKRASFGQQYYDKFYNNQNQASQVTKYYRVQCGAFSNKDNAIKLKNQLKSLGFNSIIKQVDNLFKVQLGAYSNKNNANDMLKKIKSKGFNAVIVYC